MLKLQNIYAGYGELEVLKEVDITVQANEIVALIGPNGAGKSTVLRSIFAFSNVTAGKIIFNEKIIFRENDSAPLKTHELLRLGISYVPQGKINFMDLSVKENLELGAEFIKDQQIIQKNRQRVYALFPILKEKQNKLAFSLSGGQQQMLALGRALMQNPSLLLLDEPSLGLSPKLQKELFEMLVRLKKEEGISLLIVEQNAKKAMEIADRTYLLEEGKVVLEGGKEIIKHPKIKEVYLGGRY